MAPSVLAEEFHGPEYIPIKNDSEETLLAELPSTHTLPLWDGIAGYVPPVPKPKAQPYVWDYEKIRPYLIRAGHLVPEEKAERRVLMLINPQCKAPRTTDTLYAGLQCVMPNEVALAHRHTAFATRFIIEGMGGFTAVQGERINMQRGDFILTPVWNWHDHGNDASGPMIWLDGLDLPQFQHFPVHFLEHYSESRYPATNINTENSTIVWKWHRTQDALDRQLGPFAIERYLTQTGDEVSKRLGAQAERIDAGSQSPERRETASAVYHVVSGRGHTIIGGERFDWKDQDTFCIPSWTKYCHLAEAEQTVYLYRFDDTPMLKLLGYYREEGKEVQF